MDESMNDKYSIKNLLFYRAIPPYKPPDPGGHMLYSCTDCGDKFVLESSYNYHINRKSVKITYKCRHCDNGDSQKKVFYNRCNLLSHIRSHSFKTATINVTDLKIEPLPLSFFKTKELTNENTNTKASFTTPTPSIHAVQRQAQNSLLQIICHECKCDINFQGVLYKDRASHYTRYSNEVYSCPVCLLSLPTSCALKAHLRIHLKVPPYYCPECGINLSNKSINYPFNHSCQGFNMMRATVRLNCQKINCNIFHPNDFKDHMKQNHLKKVFRCPFCVVACFNEETISKHLIKHGRSSRPLIFYQCELCPGRLVLQNHLDQHLSSHIGAEVYPCWTCGTLTKDIPNLIDHHVAKHINDDHLKKMYLSLRKGSINNINQKKVYRVVKRCDQCLRSFTYKCQFEEINILPTDCPYKCTSKSQTSKNLNDDNSVSKIVCPLCKIKIDQTWKEVKKHYAEHHKNHRCVDAIISVQRIDLKKYTSQNKIQRSTRKVMRKTISKKSKRLNRLKGKKTNVLLERATPDEAGKSNSDLVCRKCQQECEDKDAFESHLKSHRDPCMAYQCLECGESFVVKPSFATHLLVEHGISEVEEYIHNKHCFDEIALEDNTQKDNDIDEPLDDNQCKICKERYENTEELEKHFRVHGMAFLIKNSLNKPNAT